MLQYPTSISGDSDYIVFKHFEYRPNNRGGRSSFGSGANSRAWNPPASGEGIRLYVPESTPQTQNINEWQRKDFVGPMGILAQNLMRGLAGGGFGTNNSLPAAMGQGILDALAKQGGLENASQLTALKGGEVYNPNVELLYKTPSLRAFDFQFRFLPSNMREASMVRNIIREFKTWSAPEEAGDMFNVPHLWSITYMNAAGDASQFMGKFKNCALTNVTVQANTSSAYHTTFSDGNPVEYVLGLGFQEVDVITRADHESQTGGIGY